MAQAPDSLPLQPIPFRVGDEVTYYSNYGFHRRGIIQRIHDDPERHRRFYYIQPSGHTEIENVDFTNVERLPNGRFLNPRAPYEGPRPLFNPATLHALAGAAAGAGVAAGVGAAAAPRPERIGNTGATPNTKMPKGNTGGTEGGSRSRRKRRASRKSKRAGRR